MILASFDRRFPVSRGLLLTALLLCVSSAPAQAGFQFSDWLTQSSSPATVAWNYSSGTATLTGSVPVNFRFDNIPSLSSGLQPATLTITASTSIAATLIAGPNIITEPLSGSIAISNGTNLLTIGFTGTIAGQEYGGNATVSASVTTPGDSVTFSSDYLTFLDQSGNSFQLILPTITAPPGLTLNVSGFINDFTSNVQGSASAANASAVEPIPEPASLVSVGAGLLAAGLVMMVRRTRAPR